MRLAPLVLALASFALILGVVSGRVTLDRLAILVLAFAAIVWCFSSSTQQVVLTYLMGCWFVADFPGRDNLPLEPTVVLAALVVIRLGVARGRRQAKSILRALTLAALGLFIVVVIGSTLKNGGGLAALPWILGPGAVLVLANAPRASLPAIETVAKMSIVVFAITAIRDLVMFIGADVGNQRYFNVGRFMGSINDYELAGEYYALGALVCVSTVLTTQDRRMQLLAYVAGATGVFLVLQTQTRGALLILALGSLVLWHRAIRSSPSRSKSVSFAVAVAGAGWLLGKELLRSDAFSRFGTERTAGSFSGQINRSGVWSYFQALPSYQSAGYFGNGLEYPYEIIGTYPHSLYLWSIWSVGFAGVTLLLGALGGVVLLCLGARRKADGVTFTWGLVLLLQLMHEIKIEVSREASTTMLLWGLAATAVLAYRSVTPDGTESVGEASRRETVVHP